MARISKKHPGPHKYLRIKSRRKDGTDYVVFKCQIPYCTSHKPMALLIGDVSECWKCGRAFQLNKKALQLARPHCMMCTGTSNALKNPIDLKKVEENLDKLLGDSFSDILNN